ncbi:hypothetical protein [Candidatus Protofrankia californiensis]|uniref:hypothetical protein n=1 Tax=Candidatus Protofrankia californiensis TaxID=1839754 RepID=UPI001041BD11|nr:hypothetical protein [Candidatus Protofrankia californiensis]
MPTFDAVARFLAEYSRLSPAERAAFDRARRLFVQALREGRKDPRLRTKPFRKKPGVWELTWAPDGRALWMYGDPVPGKPGPHIIWLRVGTHDIFER